VQTGGSRGCIVSNGPRRADTWDGDTMSRLLHPDIAHYSAIAEENKRQCDSIDKHWDRVYAKQSSTGAHSEVRCKQRAYMPTAHDLAANNPILRDMLRKMMR